jgi:large subunit ribosomal protein L30
MALVVTQRKSRNGSDKRQLATLRSLGLRRIGQTVELTDSPQIRGMIHKVRHLVEVEESAGRLRRPSNNASQPDHAAARRGEPGPRAGGHAAGERRVG